MPIRPLETYPYEVLVEYIRRQSWFPSELEKIATEMYERGATVSACTLCKDAGVIERGYRIAWCQCAASETLQAKDPQLVERWNAHRAQPIGKI